jgi:GNAT superfamily N-acetyltransferase
MPEIEMKEARTRSERRRFVEVPRLLYRAEPAFVPPLAREVLARIDPRRNPFFLHGEAAFYLALRGGEAVGRISVSTDRLFDEARGEPVALFGFLDCVDDGEVLDALLEVARAGARARGRSRLLGPINLSTNYECGLLVEGFEEAPTVGMNYHPRYLSRLLESRGLAKGADLLAYAVTEERFDVERMLRLSERLAARGRFAIRPLRRGRLDEELQRGLDVYRRSWARNLAFAPPSDEEFRFLARGMKPILVPDFCLFAESDGGAVGFLLAVPDVNEVLAAIDGRLFPFGVFRFPFLLKKVRRVRVLLLGVPPEHRRLGVDAALIGTLVRNGLARGYRAAELSWVLEENLAMRGPIEAVGGVVTKRYRIYETGSGLRERGSGTAGGSGSASAGGGSGA